MAHNGTSQGQMHLVDEHGNRVDQTEGNATLGTAMGFAPVGTGTGTGDDAMKKGHEHHHDEGQQLRRSGSSSSSSSENDGEGGRRKKKGIKEKIKETLTGGTDDKKELGDQQLPPQITPTPTPTTEAEEGEKKGMMEKIPRIH
ncbi:hypothetical protein K7X08_017359 [Anisodus acutangulus]|uniref:Dehydrin n=1 Tax=Anisodus acutangulus TaxID=402998 RepID=A0A9Q1LTM0_9SOLA|nr:hypothetical protein K7X08_017359 [Anisodus acutangulus]